MSNKSLKISEGIDGVRAFRREESRHSAKKHFRLRSNASEVSLVH